MKSCTLIVALFLCACGTEAPQLVELTGGTMGTSFSVKVKSSPNDFEADRLKDQIVSLLDAIEDEMSTYRPQSTIGRFNSAASTDWQTVSEDFCLNIEQALAISRLSDGAFDITVGPLVNLWGFGPDGVVMQPPSDDLVRETLEQVGYANIETDCSIPAVRKLNPQVRIDLSAYAKGHAVDRVATLLDAVPIADYIVEIGGELRTRGTNASGDKWIIAIEVPDSTSRRIFTTIGVSGNAVATSGDYRNFFEFEGQRYSHTIDSRTGKPVTHNLASVTIVHDSAAIADALATAIQVLGPERGYELAANENIAALLLSYSKEGFDARSTPAFEEFEVTS